MVSPLVLLQLCQLGSPLRQLGAPLRIQCEGGLEDLRELLPIQIGGAVIVEQIFSLPGLGQMTLTGINQRDYPVVQGCVLFIAFIYVLVNLVTDLLYAYIDPRISYD